MACPSGEKTKRMNAAAANALLKTLEEPPAHAILMLTAWAKESVPKTSPPARGATATPAMLPAPWQRVQSASKRWRS